MTYVSVQLFLFKEADLGQHSVLNRCLNVHDYAYSIMYAWPK